MPSSIITPIGANEILARRTLRGKTFQFPSGVYRHIVGIAPVHLPHDIASFKLGGPTDWDDVDLTLEVGGNGKMGIRNSFYNLVMTDGIVGFRYVSKIAGTFQVELFKLGGIDPPIVADPVVRGDELWWDNVVPGLDFYIKVRSTGVELFKKIRTPTAPKEFTWQITENDPPILNVQSLPIGWDNLNDTDPSRLAPLPVGRQRYLELIFSQTAFQTPQAGQRRYRKTETWTGRTFTVDNSPERIKTFFNDVQYPVLIDVHVDDAISTDADDGWDDGVWNLSGYSGTGNTLNTGAARRPGYRFQGVDIPNAATITSGVLGLYVFAHSGTATGTLFGNNHDSAPAWATGVNLPDTAPAMTPTTASAVFSISADGVFNTDIKDIVQEIANRAGWVANNNMAFGIRGALSGGGYAWFRDYNYGSLYATLSIDYIVLSSPPILKFQGRMIRYNGTKIIL